MREVVDLGGYLDKCFKGSRWDGGLVLVCFCYVILCL